MAVTIRGSQTYESGSGGYSASHTLTDLDVTGTNPYSIAGGFNRNPASDVTSWTFEGNTPTAIQDSINASVCSVSVRGYVISNAATTIVSNTPSFKLQAMIGLALEGVDQSTPTTGTPVTAGGFGASATASYTGTSGNMLLVFVSTQDDRTFTASSCTTQAQVTHADANCGSGYVGYVSATGSSQTIGATWTTNTNYRMAIVEIKAAATGTNLVVNDLSTGVTLETPSLTQANTLAVADLSTGTTLENLALSQAYTLTVADISTGVTLETTALTQANTLAVADLSTGTTLETLALTQANTLTVEDLSTTPTLEAPTLSLDNVSLTVADVSIAITLETVALTQANTLAVADISTAPTLETLALTQANTLVVANLSLTPTLETVVLDAVVTLVVADLSTGVTLGTTSLTQANTLAVDSLSLTPSLENVSFATNDSPIITPITVGEQEPIAFTVSKQGATAIEVARTPSSVSITQTSTVVTVSKGAIISI